MYCTSTDQCSVTESAVPAPVLVWYPISTSTTMYNVMLLLLYSHTDTDIRAWERAPLLLILSLVHLMPSRAHMH